MNIFKNTIITKYIMSTNTSALNSALYSNEIKTCLICWESIDEMNLTFCITCNIFLHNECEKRERGVRGHCKCPHCQDIGSLGFFKNRIIK